jgi:hypothetical protein
MERSEKKVAKSSNRKLQPRRPLLKRGKLLVSILTNALKTAKISIPRVHVRQDYGSPWFTPKSSLKKSVQHAPFLLRIGRQLAVIRSLVNRCDKVLYNMEPITRVAWSHTTLGFITPAKLRKTQNEIVRLLPKYLAHTPSSSLHLMEDNLGYGQQVRTNKSVPTCSNCTLASFDYNETVHSLARVLQDSFLEVNSPMSRKRNTNLSPG